MFYILGTFGSHMFWVIFTKYFSQVCFFDSIWDKKNFFDVLLTVHLSIFISVFNQLDAQNLFHNKFHFMPLHVSSNCAHHQEVKIALHSLWYHHTETSEWSKITKIQFYKYEQIVVKFMCEFFGYDWVIDYCVLLTVNMLCHVVSNTQ